MTILYENGFACVPSHNIPWTLSSERNETTQDFDLVLHVGSCRPIRVLRGEEIRQTYGANRKKIAEAYSIITSHAWHKFKMGADIDIVALQAAVFEKWEVIQPDSAGPHVSADPSWSGSLVSFVWLHALQILKEMLGETVLIEWLTHSKIESFSTEQLVLHVVDGLPTSIILEGVIDQLRNILRDHFLLDVNIVVVTSDEPFQDPAMPLYGTSDI